LPTPFTWNNPPSVTTTNQVTIPQSTSSFQDAVINVTGLLKDQVAFGNNGFMIKLVNEVTYNSRTYGSSYNEDPTKYPQLTLYYH
jgi:hypothetical protein